MGLQSEKFDFGPLGENTYLLTDSESGAMAIVDPGCFSEELYRKIDQSAGLAYILLTHAHGDHIAALNRYRERYPSAQLVAGAKERELLESADLNSSLMLTGTRVEMSADRYATDGEVLLLGETEIRVITTPGHTMGGVCFYADGTLYSGDTLFERSVGRTDLYGGDWTTLKASIRNKLFLLPDDTVVYPGHGRATTIGEEKRGNPFV